METIFYILIFGFLMSLIALVGVVTLFLSIHILNAIMLPLIAFAAGALIGGAVFHMIPSAVATMGNETEVYVWIMAGFTLFMGLEQFLNWHHSHTHAHSCGPLSPAHNHGTCSDHSQTHLAGLDNNHNAVRQDDTVESAENGVCTSTTVVANNESETTGQTGDDQPTRDTNSNNNRAGSPEDDDELAKYRTQQRESLGYLIVIADAVHNFVGGMSVGASFVDSTDLGVTAWIAAAAHEVPQELGDFAILVHGGWSYSGALCVNFLSALTFPLGMIVAYVTSQSFDVSFLVPFAAGNFIYIGATDLIPEVKHCRGIKREAVNYLSFLLGLGILLAIRIHYKGW